MKSFAVAGVNNFFAGVPIIHEDIDALVIVGWKSFNHFQSQVVLTLEGQSLVLAVGFLIVGTIIPCIGAILGDYMSSNQTMTPDELPCFM